MMVVHSPYHPMSHPPHVRHFSAGSPHVAQPPLSQSHSRHYSTSPTHSYSPSSSSSGGSGSVLKYSVFSAGSGRWTGSDGTAATSEGDSPAVRGATTVHCRPGGNSPAMPPPPPPLSTSNCGEDGSAGIRRSVSTPSFRGPVAPAIKRKASGGSSSGRSEAIEGREEIMRRVGGVNPKEGMPIAGRADATMREATASPEGVRKQRRRKDEERDRETGKEVEDGGGRPASVRRRQRSKRAAGKAKLPAPPVEEEEPEPHIDIATYPQQELLRLLASLLQQIATANDALRPSSSGSLGSFAGGLVSLASGFSSPGGSLAQRSVQASDQSERQAAAEYHYQSNTPWNSMPTTPVAERASFVADPIPSSRRQPTLSQPPTPGASRPGSPVISRYTPLAPVWNLVRLDDLFTASRVALTSTSATLAFHARNVPQIGIEAYLLRILKYCPTSNEVFLSLLVYFDRMAKMGPLLSRGSPESVLEDGQGRSGEDIGRRESVDEGVAAAARPRPFAIDSYNVHRLVIAGVTVASKFFSDVFYTNSRYAKVGGLPLYELDRLELQFLLLNDFRLVIPLEEMQRYADQLLMHWAGAKGTSGYREPKAPAASPPPPQEAILEEEDENSSSNGDECGADDGDKGEIPPSYNTERSSSYSAASFQYPALSASIPSGPEGDSYLFSSYHPGLPRARPSISGMSISSAQSSEASASTVTPGTPRQGWAVARDFEDSGDEEEEERVEEGRRDVMMEDF